MMLSQVRCPKAQGPSRPAGLTPSARVGGLVLSSQGLALESWKCGLEEKQLFLEVEPGVHVGDAWKEG